MNVEITYCGGWGYFSRFRRVKTILEANVPGLNIIGTATPDVSGAFEVVNTKTKKVYFSKHGGQGHLDGNKDAMQQVINDLKADAAA